jgi:hypothetical protein
MARPIKNNADYFSHDSDMRDDPKIKALRRKFGVAGYGVWCMLLESITDSENFRLNMDLEIMAGDYDIEPDFLDQVIQYCLKLDLLQDQNGVISCRTLEHRLATVIDKRAKAKEQSKEQPRLHGRFTSNNTGQPVKAVTEMPQSKVKESKVFISIGTEGKNFISVKPTYANDRPLRVYDLAEYFLSRHQLETFKIKGWTHFDAFLDANPSRVFNDEDHVYNAFKSFSEKYIPPARAPNKFEDAEYNKSLWTLNAWEEKYAKNIDTDPEFRKYFGYDKSQARQPVGGKLAS